eukprot:1799086-Alexandrium_andersonii.AAC.1
MRWLDDLGVALELPLMDKCDRPPVDIDSLRDLSFDKKHLSLLADTCCLHTATQEDVEMSIPPESAPTVAGGVSRGELDTPPP